MGSDRYETEEGGVGPNAAADDGNMSRVGGRGGQCEALSVLWPPIVHDRLNVK